MSGLPTPGDVVLVGPAAGTQFDGGRHLVMRVAHAREATWEGMAWLDGYVLNPQGDAVEHREIYVQINGLRRANIPAPSRHAEARNAGPVQLPRQRISPETTRRNR